MSEFIVALDGARTLARIDEIARGLWLAHGAGNISDGEAEQVAARIEEARHRVRPHDRVQVRVAAVPLAAVSMFPPRKRRCVSPDRAASRARRRRLAYSGPLPPALAAGFTPAQLAVLRIVADQVRARTCCALTLSEIAARAGCGVTTARDAIRLAAGDGLLVIIERRRHGAPSLPNLVRVVSRVWGAWLFRAGGGGSKFPNPTDSHCKSKRGELPKLNVERLRRKNARSEEAKTAPPTLQVDVNPSTCIQTIALGYPVTL